MFILIVPPYRRCTGVGRFSFFFSSGGGPPQIRRLGFSSKFFAALSKA